MHACVCMQVWTRVCCVCAGVCRGRAVAGGSRTEGEARAAHAWRCLPGQDRQVMLDTDDLEYESMYGDEEDYDEVPEMDSSEQPVMGGELPCAHLEQRMEPPGATVGAPGLCWGDAFTSHLAVGPCTLLAGGIWDLQLAPRWSICSPSQHCAAHSVQTLCSVPPPKALAVMGGLLCQWDPLPLAGFLCSWS